MYLALLQQDNFAEIKKTRRNLTVARINTPTGAVTNVHCPLQHYQGNTLKPVTNTCSLISKHNRIIFKLKTTCDSGRTVGGTGHGGSNAPRREAGSGEAGRADRREPAGRATLGETSDLRTEQFAHIPDHLLATYGPGTYSS
jgi:hypothetical protein